MNSSQGLVLLRCAASRINFAVPGQLKIVSEFHMTDLLDSFTRIIQKFRITIMITQTTDQIASIKDEESVSTDSVLDILGDPDNFLNISLIEYTPPEARTYLESIKNSLICWDNQNNIWVIDTVNKRLVVRVPVTDITEYAETETNGYIRLKSKKYVALKFGQQSRELMSKSLISNLAWLSVPSGNIATEGVRMGLAMSSLAYGANNDKLIKKLDNDSDKEWWETNFKKFGVKVNQRGLGTLIMTAVLVLFILGILFFTIEFANQQQNIFLHALVFIAGLAAIIAPVYIYSRIQSKSRL